MGTLGLTEFITITYKETEQAPARFEGKIESTIDTSAFPVWFYFYYKHGQGRFTFNPKRPVDRMYDSHIEWEVDIVYGDPEDDDMEDNIFRRFLEGQIFSMTRVYAARRWVKEE